MVAGLLSKWLGHTREPGAGACVMIRGSRLVQGGYSMNVERAVYAHKLRGWVRPHDSFIEMDLEGRKASIEKFIEALKDVPLLCTVSRFEVSWKKQLEGFKTFRMRA